MSTWLAVESDLHRVVRVRRTILISDSQRGTGPVSVTAQKGIREEAKYLDRLAMPQKGKYWVHGAEVPL